MTDDLKTALVDHLSSLRRALDNEANRREHSKPNARASQHSHGGRDATDARPDAHAAATEGDGQRTAGSASRESKGTASSGGPRAAETRTAASRRQADAGNKAGAAGANENGREEGDDGSGQPLGLLKHGGIATAAIVEGRTRNTTSSSSSSSEGGAGNDDDDDDDDDGNGTGEVRSTLFSENSRGFDSAQESDLHWSRMSWDMTGTQLHVDDDATSAAEVGVPATIQETEEGLHITTAAAAAAAAGNGGDGGANSRDGQKTSVDATAPHTDKQGGQNHQHHGANLGSAVHHPHGASNGEETDSDTGAAQYHRISSWAQHVHDVYRSGEGVAHRRSHDQQSTVAGHTHRKGSAVSASNNGGSSTSSSSLACSARPTHRPKPNLTLNIHMHAGGGSSSDNDAATAATSAKTSVDMRPDQPMYTPASPSPAVTSPSGRRLSYRRSSARLEVDLDRFEDGGLEAAVEVFAPPPQHSVGAASIPLSPSSTSATHKQPAAPEQRMVQQAKVCVRYK